MKKCITCKKDKDLEHFGKLAKNKDGLQSKCLECKREYDNNYHAHRDQEGRAKKRDIQKKRKQNLVVKKLDYLKDRCCADCGETDPIVLDFDHDNPEDKEYNISDMLRKSYSFKRILREIKKCTIRCANCHRKRTAKQFGWYKGLLGTTN